MIMQYVDAKKIAQEFLNDMVPKLESGDRYMLIEPSKINVADGWYFTYQPSKYVLTWDKAYFLVGGHPIFVRKIDGKVGFRFYGEPF